LPSPRLVDLPAASGSPNSGPTPNAPCRPVRV
jgi:hypothetical protein